MPWDNDGVDSEQITITVSNPPPPPPVLWINELHYDNIGGDVDQGFEIAGTAGASLSGYSVELYDGGSAGFYVYSNLVLSGTLDAESNGFGALWFEVGGTSADNMQNGPDGLALVYNSTQVLQFLSYEGAITVTNGAASGMTATDIGVSESGTTLVGHSLQLCGTGTNYPGFHLERARDEFDGVQRVPGHPVCGRSQRHGCRRPAGQLGE